MARTWSVAIYVFDVDDPPHGGVTKAHAVLTTSSGLTLDGYGRVARGMTHDGALVRPSDRIAAARALRDLAHHLLSACSDELSELGFDEVEILR